MRLSVDSLPAHPGYFIRQHVLPAAGLTSAELSRMMGISQAALHYILSGRTSISASTAVRLSVVFDVPAKSWLDLQQRYDIAMAELKLSEVLPLLTPYRGQAIDLNQMLAGD